MQKTDGMMDMLSVIRGVLESNRNQAIKARMLRAAFAANVLGAHVKAKASPYPVSFTLLNILQLCERVCEIVGENDSTRLVTLLEREIGQMKTDARGLRNTPDDMLAVVALMADGDLAKALKGGATVTEDMRTNAKAGKVALSEALERIATMLEEDGLRLLKVVLTEAALTEMSDAARCTEEEIKSDPKLSAAIDAVAMAVPAIGMMCATVAHEYSRIVTSDSIDEIVDAVIEADKLKGTAAEVLGKPALNAMFRSFMAADECVKAYSRLVTEQNQKASVITAPGGSA